MTLTESNYHSKEANAVYMSNSQLGQWIKCAARQSAIESGTFAEPEKEPLHFLKGKLVDDLLTSPGKAADDLANDQSQYFYGEKTRKRYAWVDNCIAMAERCKSDPAFMAMMKGTTQAIITFEWLGMLWKCKLDVLQHSTKSIVDLKTNGRAFDYDEYDVELGVRVPFYQTYDYWRQATVYTRAVIEETGDRYKFFLAAVTTQDPPDIEVFEFRGDHNWKAEEIRIARYVEMIKAIRSGKQTPEKCGHCDYCRATKKITTPIKAEYFRPIDLSGGELLSGVGAIDLLND